MAIWNGPCDPKKLKRNTVLSGSVDANGYPNFLEAGTGLAVNLLATTVPIVISFADGYDRLGPQEKIERITSNVTSAWSGLTDNSTNYLYMELTGDTISYDFTTYKPYYGSVPNLTGGLDSYVKLMLHCDGDDNSTTFTDSSISNHTVTAVNQAHIHTAEKKFGTASAAFDGAADYLTSDHHVDWELGTDPWTLDFWMNMTAETVTSPVAIWADANNYWHPMNYGGPTNRTCYIRMYASAYIYSLSFAYTFVTGQWYHIEIARDTTQMYAFINGVKQSIGGGGGILASVDCTVPNGLLRCCSQNASGDFNGHLDEIRLSAGIVRHTATFTPLEGAYTVPDNQIWYSIPKGRAQLTTGSTGAATNKKIVFVGECVTSDGSVTSVTPYALNGEYAAHRFAVSASTNYTKNHNIGTELILAQAAASTSGGGVLADKQQSALDYKTVTFNSGASAVEGSVIVERAF